MSPRFFALLGTMPMGLLSLDQKMMDSILDDVKRPRNLNYKVNDKNPPNQVLWIQAFGPSTKEIRTVVEEASLMLQKCPVWSKDNNPIGIVPRRAKNLGDMILKRKKLALTTSDYNPSNFIQKRSTLCILPARGANTGGGGWGYSSPQRFRPSPQLIRIPRENGKRLILKNYF